MTPPVTSAAAYHRTTSYRRHGLTPHALDWAHQPQLIKRYPPLDRIPLEPSGALPRIDYFDLVPWGARGAARCTASLDLETLATLLQLTHTVTARSRHGGQVFYYRSVASAGALYPFELYLAIHAVDGVPSGVYHYDLFDGSLAALRQEAVTPIPPPERRVAATIYLSGIFFRSAWKYRSRAYRYVLLDGGHLLENLRLALSALGIDHTFHLDFDDAQVNRLLGLDPRREVCLAGVHLTGGGEGPPGSPASTAPPAPLSAAIAGASRVSTKEVVYEEIQQAHRAGYGQTVKSPDGRDRIIDCIGRPPTSWQTLSRPDRPAAVDYVDTLWRRRSRRNFVPAPLSDDQLAHFLGAIADAAATGASSLLTVGCLVGDGLSIRPGSYVVDPRGPRLGLCSEGNLMTPMAAACLDQMWLKHAALHLLLITDPVALDRAGGARSYRHAMIEAGRLGQQAYLTATALGLGACGIGAIYDGEAAALLDLADDAVLLYLIGVGPVKTR